MGMKIDNYIIGIMEAIAIASFLRRSEKLPYVRSAIIKNDALKIFLMILWETKSLDNNKYLQLSEKAGEIGRMLGGWHGNLTSPEQNSSARPKEK